MMRLRSLIPALTVPLIAAAEYATARRAAERPPRAVVVKMLDDRYEPAVAVQAGG